jgi:hypothetical protein
VIARRLPNRGALIAAVFGSSCLGKGPIFQVALTSPPNSTAVSGVVKLVATAAPAGEVSTVDFLVNGVSVGTASGDPAAGVSDGGASFSLEWDSSVFVGETITVTARARSDSGGLGISSSIQLFVSRVAPPLPKGKESMYTLVNEGDLTFAEELLQDEWDFGQRATPYYMSPVSWVDPRCATESCPGGIPAEPPDAGPVDPYMDSYWRFIFYSLRPTSNLLWAYYTTGNTAYRDKLTEILASYVARDQVRGVEAETFDDNYTAAFRAMVLVNSYVKLKQSGDLPVSLDQGLLNAITKVANELADGADNGNSKNDGLVTLDYSGLFTAAGALLLAGENFPNLGGSDYWTKNGLARLNNSIVNAIDSDGVETENSPFYHLYLMTFAQEIATWAGLWGVSFLSSDSQSRIDMMANYAAYVLQPDGKVPLLGASIATSVSSLDPDAEASFAAVNSSFAYMSSWGDAGVQPSQRARLFPNSGQSTLRSGFDFTPDPALPISLESFVTFNVGHYRNPQNHLDVLGITYFADGRSLLTDSGLYTYDTSSPYYAYFFGTAAHNTVVVDGSDQSKAQLVQAGLTSNPETSWAYQSGAHELYADGGVLHQRAVLLAQKDILLVVDRLTSEESHTYTQTWHLAKDLLNLTSQGPLVARAPGAVPVLMITQGLDGGKPNAIMGSSSPMQGWFSDSYGILSSNYAIEYSDTGTSASFVTLITSGPFAVYPPGLVVDQDISQVVRLHFCASSLDAGTVQTQVEIDNLAAGTPQESVTVGPFDGGCPQ